MHAFDKLSADSLLSSLQGVIYCISALGRSFANVSLGRSRGSIGDELSVQRSGKIEEKSYGKARQSSEWLCE